MDWLEVHRGDAPPQAWSPQAAPMRAIPINALEACLAFAKV